MPLVCPCPILPTTHPNDLKNIPPKLKLALGYFQPSQQYCLAATPATWLAEPWPWPQPREGAQLPHGSGVKFGTTAPDSQTWDGHLERGAVNLAANVHAPFSVLLGTFSLWLVPWAELQPRVWEHEPRPHAWHQGRQHHGAQPH